MKKTQKNNLDEEYIKEKNLKNCPKEVSLEQSEYINKQMKNSICKIKCKDGSTGTGFFCIIPFPDKKNVLPALITNYHVLSESDVMKGKNIEFYIGNNKSSNSIKIDDSRKIYTNEIDYDVTIIEMKKSDNIKYNNFMDLDEQLFETENKIKEQESKYEKIMETKYNQKTVYLIHYPFGQDVKYSLGVILGIEDGITIKHLCNSQTGSSGGPLISLINFKVIGIHKGYEKDDKNYNFGTLLNLPIKRFYEEDFEKSLNFEEGDFLSVKVWKSAQNFKIDYRKFKLNLIENKKIKNENKNEIYTIKDLNNMIKSARKDALLGLYDRAFERYSIGILIIKYRQREIQNENKSLKEKWENFEKKIKSELDEVIEIMKIMKTFNKIY